LVKNIFLGRKRWTRRSTLFKENDSIAQKNEYNGTSSSVFWSFKDTVGGTRSHGNYWRDEFSFKVYTALNGGVDKVIEQCMKKSSNLDKSLDYEINTFSVKVNGLVKNLKPLFSSNFYK
jgi:hypothetical protein